MRILGIGESVIDEISVVREGGGVVATDRDAGGPVLVAMIMLARLGGDCSFMTSLGEDGGGEHVQSLMEQEHVKLMGSRHPSTKINAIVVDERTGQRRKIHSGVEYPPIADTDPAFLQSFDIIIMDRHEREAFYEVAAHKLDRTRLIIDPSSELSAFTLEMMRTADCPIVPIETLAQIEGQETLSGALTALRELCGQRLVVTLGEFGSLICDGAAMRLIPAFEVEAVNTLGAGDVYRGAFAYGILNDWTPEACATYGNAAAALQCTKLGNATAVPGQEAVEHLMREGVRRRPDAGALEDYFQQLRREFSPALVSIRN